MNPPAPVHQLRSKKGRRDTDLIWRTAFLQDKPWGGSSPALCLQAATVPGQGLPRPAPTRSAPRVGQGWEHLGSTGSSTGPAPGDPPRVVPYQPSPKQVRAGAPRIWPNKPFSATASAAGSAGTSGRGGEIKGKNQGENRVPGPGRGTHILWEAAHTQGTGAC